LLEINLQTAAERVLVTLKQVMRQLASRDDIEKSSSGNFTT